MIEVIVVVALLGIVATIGGLSMSGVQHRGNINADKLEAAEIGNAVLMADIENGRRDYSNQQIGMKLQKTVVKNYLYQNKIPKNLEKGG